MVGLPSDRFWPIADVHLRPLSARSGRSTRVWLIHRLGHVRVKMREHDHALLSGRLVPNADKHCRDRLTPVDRDMGYVRRDEQVIADLDDLAVLKSIAGPQLHLVAAQKVERRLVPLVNMRLCTLAGRQGHDAKKQGLGADRFLADPWRIYRPLLALIGVLATHNSSFHQVCRGLHTHSPWKDHMTGPKHGQPPCASHVADAKKFRNFPRCL